MSDDRTEEDTAFDADQLAALARPSLPPTQDEDDDDDDGPLDLKALTASMAPPPPTNDEAEDDEDDDGRVSMASAPVAASAASAVSTAESGAKTTGAKTTGAKETSGKKAPAKSEATPATAPAATPAVEDPPSGGGSGKMLIGVTVLVGIGAIAFAFLRNPGGEEQAALYPPIETNPVTHEEPADDPLDEAGNENVDENVGELSPDPLEGDEGTDVEAGSEVGSETVAATDENTDVAPTANGNDTRRRRPNSMDTQAVAMEATMETTVDPSMEAVAQTEPSMEAEPTMESEPTMEASSMDDMDDLLTRALGGTPTEGGTMTAATAPMMAAVMEDRSALPETPSRPAVTRALGGLMARMRQCAGDQVGMATARLRVNNNGQVVSANIGGSPFGGTPQGACMERVVQTARFPRFQRTHFDVTYPFSIRPIN